jgi:death-on-curing protein
MISREETEKLHTVLIESFGGTNGIRDISALESALARPFQTFDNNELYPAAIEKAASLIESILTNHRFVDGNKRTGLVLVRLYLINSGFDINATKEEKHEFVISIATGKRRFEEIVMWLETHIK